MKTLSLLLAGIFLSACSFSLAGDVTPPPGYQPPQLPAETPTAPLDPTYPVVAPSAAKGAPIYAEKCAPCHGESGLGDGSQAAQLPNPIPLIGSPEVAREAYPMDWFNVITAGRLDRFMPPFKASLSDQERWDVLAYVFSLSEQVELVQQGNTLYQANCANCHGDRGQADGSASANLTEKPTSFTDPIFLAERSGADLYQAITAGVPPTMPAYEAMFTPEERWAMVAYVRTFGFGQGSEEIAEQGPELPPESSADDPPSENEVAEDAVAEPIMGIVKGRIVNGSGSDLPADLDVTLHGFDHIEEVFQTSTRAGADGTYTFSDVEMPEGRIFMVAVDYSAATYTSDIGIADPDTEILDLPVTVYETSTDHSMLVVDRLHIFLDQVDPDVIQVTELYLISNPGDRVVIPAEAGQPVIRFNVPEGAFNLRFQTGESGNRFIETETGFGDTMGVPPGMGQHQVMFAYDMPYDRGLDLRHKLTLPVNSVIFLMPDMGVRVKSDRLQDGGVREIQGQSYQVFVSDQLSAGEEFAVSLSGASRGLEAALIGSGSTGNLVAGLGILGVTLVVAGVWLYRRAPRTVDEADGEVEEYADQETLLDAIIALDDLYCAGDLPEEAYRQRRAELKDRLREMRS